MKKQVRFIFALLCFVSLSLSMPTKIANAEETPVIEMDEIFDDGTSIEEVKTEVSNDMLDNSINDDTAIEEETIVEDETIVEESVANEPSQTNNVEIKALAKSVYLEPKMYIDVPANNQKILNQSIRISGWALNSSGIKEVRILLDGNIVGNATIGIERTDVDKVYPGYPNGAKSGYEYMLDISQIKPGNHYVTVEAVGIDGKLQRKEVAVNIVKPQPKMYIDTPKMNEIIQNKSIRVSGWALNASGIKEVNILIDGQLMGNAKIGLERRDVDKAYPGYTNGVNSGFEYILDINNVKQGNRHITVQAVGIDGTIQSSSIYINMNKPEPKMYIDSPKGNETIQNTSMKISGWALNPSGVKEVQIAIDGTTVGNAKIGLERRDVDKAYPGYTNGANSGFEYMLNLNAIKPGSHNVTVKAIGVDGTSQSSIVKITVLKPVSRTYIDTPAPSANINPYISGQINVSGWALNASGVKEVQIAVDGTNVGTAKTGIERRDVDKTYPGYTGGVNSGYEYVLNISALKLGAHTITVKAIGNDGTSQSNNIEINIAKPEPKIYIDAPTNFEKVYTGEVKISGWALHASGVKQVRIIANGQTVGDARIGIERVDVDKAYPGYKNGTFSGFEYLLNVSKFSVGNHVITVEAIGNDNTSIQTSTTIQVYASIVYKNNYYDATLNEVINIQMTINPQTDLYGDGWKTATWEDTAQKMNPNNFIDSNLIMVSNSGAEVLGVGKVTASPKLNVRNKPTTNNSTIIATVDEGKEYTITGQSNGWYKITTETGITGWVSGAYIEVNYTNSSKLTTLEIKKALYVRSEPTTATNNNFALARVGEKYTIQGQTNGWYKIKVGDRLGWVEISDNRGLCVSILSNPVTSVSNPLYITADQISAEMYQFLNLNTNIDINEDSLNRYLSGKGKFDGQAKTFIDASKDYNVNIAYLVAHAMLETGHGSSNLANGTAIIDGKTVYNFFGIAAYDGTAYLSGSQYAYKQKWFKPEDAIRGGAEWISMNYVNSLRNNYQNTIYKMRWNPLNPASHQYATDMGWPVKISNLMGKIYQLSDNYDLIFDIPVYK
ncbi:Ig-like domain-containing protein [Alkalibaculum bacchi]|uniref:Ig-like domain-containing protein n=1 Tax=Alkalibaculum bacchi TaxID=645887 RepID=UPI0026EB4195|nr:Ig-like domain-containing protein [Alkalibaculum bacchi]